MFYDFNSPGYSINFDSIEYAMAENKMFKNLVTNDTFREQLLSRIEEFSDTVFNFEDMSESIDKYQAFIADPMRKNDKRFYGDDSLE